MAKISAKQRVYIRRKTRRGPEDEDFSDGELNIVPFLDIVINLIMFLLMVTSSVAFYTQTAAALPTYDGAIGPRGARSLAVSVSLTEQGIIVASTIGQFAPGCEEMRDSRDSSAVTVPLREGRFDWSSLTVCMTRVAEFAARSELPFRDQDGQAQVTLTAGPQVVYQDLLWAMDAMREDDGEPLFPSVLLSAGVR